MAHQSSRPPAHAQCHGSMSLHAMLALHTTRAAAAMCIHGLCRLSVCPSVTVALANVMAHVHVGWQAVWLARAPVASTHACAVGRAVGVWLVPCPALPCPILPCLALPYTLPPSPLPSPSRRSLLDSSLAGQIPAMQPSSASQHRPSLLSPLHAGLASPSASACLPACRPQPRLGRPTTPQPHQGGACRARASATRPASDDEGEGEGEGGPRPPMAWHGMACPPMADYPLENGGQASPLVRLSERASTPSHAAGKLLPAPALWPLTPEQLPGPRSVATTTSKPYARQRVRRELHASRFWKRQKRHLHD